MKSDPTSSLEEFCPICGAFGRDFEEVLWQDLILEWELSPAQSAYINRQQGERCKE